jgi:galactokinase
VPASAPGRVNLIGEHTDYNGGVVLPIAIARRTDVTVALRSDLEVRAVSSTVEDHELRYRRGAETRTRRWIDYIQGLTWALDERGLKVPGFDLAIRSSIPPGSGLASSAALEVAVLRGLRTALQLPLDDLALARVAHRAETGFVGAPVGIMDQCAASLADTTHALFIDTRTMEMLPVRMPDGVVLAVIDSGITHDHAAGGYRERRAECERAAAAAGVASLSDLSASDLPYISTLQPPLDRRVRHVVTENARVHTMVSALAAGDLRAVGRLLVESHASMRDDFEVSLPEIDVLVQCALEQTGVLGARLTGGGFGGAVIALITEAEASRIAEHIRQAYHAKTGRAGRVLLPIVDGVAR